MISEFYGKKYSLHELSDKSRVNRSGTSFHSISEAAESIGFRTLAVKLDVVQLEKEAPLPCILHWNRVHFVVLYKIKKGRYWIADPVGHKAKLSKQEFLNSWTTDPKNPATGAALLFEPTHAFYESDDSVDELKKKSFSFVFSYLIKYKKFLVQLLIGLLAGSMIQLAFPFLTQAIVDIGINTRDIGFIYLILLGQLMLFFSRTTIEFIRQWILLHLSTRINISIISDFLIKLMTLPLSFFDSKNIGDILHRINDHSRIQQFLNGSSLNLLFSLFNILVFGVVLIIYHPPIFFIFLIGSTLYLVYLLFFMKKRRELDYIRFNRLSTNQSSLIQLIYGITEIKLNGAERQKRWEWESIQASLFKVNVESTKLLQIQESGSIFINELKNILITVVAATAVVNGEMTLGMMLAVQYIIGQLNAPLNEAINFSGQWQDAKISLERIGEILALESEKTGSQNVPEENKSIVVNKLSFGYRGPILAINNVDVTIPEGKVTALVGPSGSGKTTLMKLILRIYEPSQGNITIGTTPLNDIDVKIWRKKCGVVMQDGFIFADTIANNICVSEDFLDESRLIEACKVANIYEYISELPLGFHSKLGEYGKGLSEGQKQRLLIARAIYKDPDYLFFDEATSSLDAKNEREIVKNLADYFKNKTVFIIAHRLSTVRNADNILVINKGEISEQGSHEDLVEKKGTYYTLIKNQLELGK